MFVYRTSNFIMNPVLSIDGLKESPIMDMTLFGQKFTMYSDEWKRHVHLKCTDRCDARCGFCIEESERNNPQDMFGFMDSTEELLDQMTANDYLRTVSITGGEPTLFPMIDKLITKIQSYDLKLFSINSNGAALKNIPNHFNGWINISKHAIDDRHIFNRKLNVTPEYIDEFRARVPAAKVRIQCVLGAKEGLQSIGDILKLMETFTGHVDDFSFRSLIIDDDHSKIPLLFTEFRKFLFEFGTCKEQAIQDYYVYETFDLNGTSITISYSNMNLLRVYNETTPDNNFLQEIIVHPDGMITGSWNKQTLVIKETLNMDSHILVENGEMFDGDRGMFIDSFFSNADDANIIEWCRDNGWSLEIDGVKHL